MKRFLAGFIGLTLTAAVVIGYVQCGTVGGPPRIQDCAAAQRAPKIDPDYAGIILPPNIAPLNFCVDEPGAGYYVRLAGAAGEPIEVTSASPAVRIPAEAWRSLLAANTGQSIEITVCVKGEDGQWARFDPIQNTVSTDPIDEYLAYRLMKPWYIKFGRMGIYQRCLASFDEQAIFDNADLGGGCVNCHAFAQNRPDPMTLHFRFPFVMASAREGSVETIETRTDFNKGPFAYPAWHPSGRQAVYSVNKILQVFHTAGETRDVVDFASDLVLYDFDVNMVTTAPGISDPLRLETFPSWSPDGRYLYFCTAPALPTESYKRFKEVRYDLARISYDPDTRAWGEVEVLLRAGDIGQSISAPRVSPDGRFVLVCLCEYGTFPIFQRDSDLYMLDLTTGTLDSLSCNSEETESWHGWSSSGRWIVFSSKRRDGVFAKPHFAHVDEQGQSGKAFVLPQEDPATYKGLVKTFSVPEFIVAPVRTDKRALARIVQAAGPMRNAGLDPDIAPRTGPRQEDVWQAAPPLEGGAMWAPEGGGDESGPSSAIVN